MNVKAATKKAEEKKSDGGVAKVSSKAIKDKKKERGEVVEEKPTESPKEAPKSDAIVSTIASEAIDLPSENVGGTAADLDRICFEIVSDLTEHAKNQAVMMWRVGKKFSQIRDKKLWSVVRREDGTFDYANFGSFVAQRFANFEFTPDHAMLLIRIAGEFTEEQAAALGSAKAKAILDARHARNSEPITEEQKNELILFGGEHSLVELKARIKRMQLPQLPTGNSTISSASVDVDDEDRDDDSDEDEDGSDDSGDEDEGPESRPAPNKEKPKPAQMTSVSFERREFSVPLVQKGSQIKPAKKIQDEPHGTYSLVGGSKLHFVVKIGEDGQIQIDCKVETPY